MSNLTFNKKIELNWFWTVLTSSILYPNSQTDLENGSKSIGFKKFVNWTSF